MKNSTIGIMAGVLVVVIVGAILIQSKYNKTNMSTDISDQALTTEVDQVDNSVADTTASNMPVDGVLANPVITPTTPIIPVTPIEPVINPEFPQTGFK